MITKDEFLQLIMKNGVNKQANNLTLKLATVTSIENGQAAIQFDEDGQPSQKTYRSFKSYNPVIGDRVFLLNNVIIGGWQP